MGLVVHFLETTCGQMGIYLSGAQAAMAKQFLNAAQVSTFVEHMGSEGVSQRMRTNRRVQSGLGEILVQFAPDTASAQPLA